MIKSKVDYLYYLESDKKSLGISRKKPRIAKDEIWKFQRLLRKVEYFKNCKRGLNKLYLYYLLYKKNKMEVDLGFTIPPNVFGPGLAICHRGTIVVNHMAKVGKNCRIHTCVNIGFQAGTSNAPIIGDNVYIGPGAKLFGNIKIANGIAIGANSIVNKSFSEENITIAGIPAKKINNRGSNGLLTKGAI
ncbi:TPA: serine O-acetyltransferase [Clostridium perfringens]